MGAFIDVSTKTYIIKSVYKTDMRRLVNSLKTASGRARRECTVLLQSKKSYFFD